ncbi:MAG: cell division protein CrgA [Acidimicrobiia bacterium]|nr:cell division protein CrgA [Acidimicrobiia bacterium]MXZ06384.1 cell division protein CrgA [Acidimicrobiia bacterium]MYD04731.1 cell division protein CrgA [Acidimicrobiia bacterium]MYF27175.1 cell division protein CrgA [Acidimicrobiia bacterium]MYH55397.1 cell division protein CrgA [Acidimicrobiia bacterium]
MCPLFIWARGVSLLFMPKSKGRAKKSRPPGRPTPPQSSSGGAKNKQSSTLYVVSMFGIMGIGVLAVVTRYVLDTSSWLLLGGLGLIGVGFLMTTNYH